MDGILVFEGDGFGKGGWPCYVGVLFGGWDVAVVDMIVCCLLGFDLVRLFTYWVVLVAGWISGVEDIWGDFLLVDGFELFD